MTFKAVQIVGAPKPITLIVADNENIDPYIYGGICCGCAGEQVSTDLDVTCIRCGGIVEYVLRQTPVI